MVRLLNLKQLQHLLALAETGSFSRAAERVYLTQSALSRSIKMLEDDLGGPLVERLGRGSELTPLGEAVAARARRVVLQVEDLRDDIARLKSGEAGSIRLGMAAGASAMLTGPFLGHCARHHPGLQVVLTRGPVQLQLQQLRQRDLDALVIDSFSLPPAPDLAVEEAAAMRVGFVCNRSHPLTRARSGTGIPFEALLNYPIACMPLLSREISNALTRRFGSHANPDLCIRLRCEDVPSLLDVVRQTDAIYFGIMAPAMPSIMAGELAELRTSPPFNETVRYALVSLDGRSESPPLSIFRRFLMERMKDD